MGGSDVAPTYETNGKEIGSVETVYVGEDNKVFVTCPACKYSKMLNVSLKTIQKMKMALNICKCKCKCGEVFEVQLEFRKSYRKEVRLSGTCQNQKSRVRSDIIVEDLSSSGIRFTMMDLVGIGPGDEIELTFRLDNANRTMVRRIAKVRWVNNYMVGAALDPSPGWEKDIGFYLMK